MRVTPKISDSPAATRNSDDAEASPLSSWTRREARVTRWPGKEGMSSRAQRADASKARNVNQFFGRNLLTSASRQRHLAVEVAEVLHHALAVLQAVRPTKAPMVDWWSSAR
jgi:hypothetical protein